MATKKTKSAKSIKSAPALRDAAQYIDSAGVKLNRNADLIIEADASGAVKSCRDAVTGTEYVGGGISDFSIAKVTIMQGDGMFQLPLIPEDAIVVATITPTAPTITVNVPLYKGKCNALMKTEGCVFVIHSGSAYLISNDELVITGDCTIQAAFEY